MEDKKQQILRHLRDLESLKKKSSSSSELRGGNQMSRLQRMQDKTFEKKRSMEDKRLRGILKDIESRPIIKLDGFGISGSEPEENSFDDFVFNRPTRTKVQKKRIGGRWLF